jgi:hypothetical protein
MAALKIDWTIMWKLFHYDFCWIYLSVGIPIRFLFAQRVKAARLGKRTFYTVASSSLASAISTWFPVVPLIGGTILINTAGDAAGESLLITVPMVALSLGIETAFVDGLLVRPLLKDPLKRQFGALLITNTLNAIIALAIGLAWAFHHIPRFIALLDN